MHFPDSGEYPLYVSTDAAGSVAMSVGNWKNGGFYPHLRYAFTHLYHCTGFAKRFSKAAFRWFAITYFSLTHTFVVSYE